MLITRHVFYWISPFSEEPDRQRTGHLKRDVPNSPAYLPLVQVVSTESDAYHLLFQGPAFFQDAVDKICEEVYVVYLLRVTQEL